MQRRWLRGTALAGVMVLVGVACGGPGGEGAAFPDGGFVVNVTLTEFAVEMDRTDIPVGVPVTFVVSNEGTIEHNLVLELDGAVEEPVAADDGSPARVDDLDPGATARITFTFDEAGTALLGGFQLGCHIAGHYEAGMVQPFEVIA